MSFFLCTIRNKEVSYHQCVNECQYSFKSACIDKMNEAYEQGRAGAINECKAIFRKYMLTKDIEGLDEVLEQLKSR